MIAQTPDESARVERVIARALGRAACLYGHPLVELLRTCRLQTRSRFDPGKSGRAPMDALHCSTRPPVEHGPYGFAASPGLYTTAWIHLGDGPHWLYVPAAPAHHRQRHLVLHDARTDRLLSLDADALASGAELVLVGPHDDPPPLSGKQVLVRSSSNMVWLVAFSPAAMGPQSNIRLHGASDNPPHRRPPAVDLWAGDDSDAFVDLVERREPAARVAPTFYANLCRALAHAPPRPDDRALIASFRRIGLAPDAALDWQQLRPQVRAGLIEGFEDASRQSALDFNLDDLTPTAPPPRRQRARAFSASLMPSLTPTSRGRAFSEAAASLSL